MSRLVDESVVLGNIHNAHEWNEVRAWLKIAPTVDAVPVVRCKDCKHYTEPNIEYCELYGAMILWGKDDFCSRGERRSDEEIIHQYHERHKEVLKEMSMPVGRNVMDALRERGDG